MNNKSRPYKTKALMPVSRAPMKGETGSTSSRTGDKWMSERKTRVTEVLTSTPLE